MDPEDLPDFLDRIHTTKESRVDVLRLVPSEGVVTEAALNDDEIKDELASVKRSIVEPLIDKLTSSCAWGPFVLFCAAGDPAYRSKPINISKTSLKNLLFACGLPPFTLVACGLKRFHLSHHIEYDTDGSEEPVALVLLLRVPRNSQSISIAMRVRLADLATVTFLTSMSEETGKKIQKKCIERRHLLAKHPLYFLALIYEDRCFEYKSWFDDILEEINVVESATGMTRNTWKMQLSSRLQDWLQDYDNLLRTLYASNTELSHFDTVTTFSVKFGDFLLVAQNLLDELRAEIGLAPLPKKDFRCLQERIAFTRSRCDLTADKTREMLER